MDFDTRVGCYAWIERDGQVLLAHWAGFSAPDGRHLRPCWTLPGGGLEPHESCEQAAVREVAEETGYAVELGPLLGTATEVIPSADRLSSSARPLLLVQLIYRATLTSGELTDEVDGSTDEARWVPLEALPALPCAGLIDHALGFLGRPLRDGLVVDETPVDEDVVARIVAAAQTAAPRGVATVIAIDGPSGSGKTTLAQAVAQDLDCPIVHMDELYPGWDGLAEAVDLVTDQVLEPLTRGEHAAYRVWDWGRGEWGPTAEVPATDLLVLEGCGSSVGRAGEYAALRVWVDAEESVRHQRGIERDGETFAPHWERWAAQELALFGPDRTAERADLTVRT
ncbi:NUDIX domain-containing protein [Ornithinimicrobium murale]|uniref:NUDIX domain-containing protein n=1 Tax=Ornithinimicrobium murale TaxID=1050153 RepID=UPI001EDDB148|nr:NUDIX domain-containing protein [Ornithinimicrobium murale]